MRELAAERNPLPLWGSYVDGWLGRRQFFNSAATNAAVSRSRQNQVFLTMATVSAPSITERAIPLWEGVRKLVMFYVLSVIICALGVGGVLFIGKDLSVHSTETIAISTAQVPSLALEAHGDRASLWSAFEENFNDPLAHLLLQFMVILLAARTIGSFFRRFGQPSVIGEITAGILLGPSLFGWLWPEASAFVFAKGSLGVLQLFSQIGVCLFMFAVGLELDLGYLRHRLQTALVVGHTSIVVPYLLGVMVALVIFPWFGVPGTSFVTFALFLGIALSITAFPVLARILADRGITKTPLGATALACAAAGDAAAWAILAIVVAVGRATGLASAFAGLGLVILFVAIMLWGVRPFLAYWFDKKEEMLATTSGLMVPILILMTAASLATQVIGIHALFGAFLAGAVMPPSERFRDNLIVRLETLSSTFLLPLFFAFSGLRTQLGSLDATSWLICAGIIAVATIGKLGGSMLPARLMGMSWNEAFSLGALMNTRGLIELIALNIGYDLGILSPKVFSMLVLMALITTFMAGPLLNLAEVHYKHGSPHKHGSPRYGPAA
jgi:Kef-type K+ transport system membrane component KefB